MNVEEMLAKLTEMPPLMEVVVSQPGSGTPDLGVDTVMQEGVPPRVFLSTHTIAEKA